MLKNGAAASALGASTDFCCSDDNVKAGAALETQEWRLEILCFVACRYGTVAIEGCRDTALSECSYKCLVAKLVQVAGFGQARSGLRNGNAIGQFAVVEDRPAAAGTTNDWAILAGRMLLAIVERLKIAEGKRRLLPLVKAERRLAGGYGRFEQGLID